MLVKAGRINRLFGERGSVMLTLYGDFPDDFNFDTPLMVKIDALWVPLYCDTFERRGVSGAVVSFADFDSDRRAEELLGKEFSVELKSIDNESDEFTLEDLIGFSVKLQDGDKGEVQMGEIVEYYDSDMNPLFEIEVDDKEILIPAVEEFIAGIDFDRQTIHFILPAGLIELQS